MEQTELRLLEAETEALRGKLPLRREALEEARRNGEVSPGRGKSRESPGKLRVVPSLFPWLLWFDMV